MINRESYMAKLRLLKDQRVIKVITGLRRSGKSTLMKMFQDELLNAGIPLSNTQYYNFEIMKYDEIRTYQSLYQLVVSNLSKDSKNYLFFDEIQQVKGWEKAINSLSIEYDVDIYITGSNAYLLSSELSTLIAGRYVEIKILPFSFKEYLELRKEARKTRRELFDDYLKYGALPQVSELPENEDIRSAFINSIYDTIIIKDVLTRNNLKDVDLLNRVFAFLAFNVGSIISTNNIANYLSKAARLDKSLRPATIGNILAMLENAFIIYKAPRYDIKGKELLKSLEKYYIADTGIRNSIVGYDFKNYGYTLENIVYLELIRRGYQVYVGKINNKEVDFVALKDGDIKYFQVTETLLGEETRKREVAPLFDSLDFYEKTILTLDENYSNNIEGIKIVNLLDFLLS